MSNLLEGDDDQLSVVLDNELASYKAEIQIKMRKEVKNGAPLVWSNPLEWWQARQKVYPHLAVLAEAILAVQATSAPTERVFSVTGRTISDERGSLLPENAEILIFLKGAWKLVDAMLEEEEEEEEEE